MDRDIYRIIVMSTAHLKKETFEFLNGGAYPISFVNDDGYGRIIRFTDSDFEDVDMPEDLIRCMTYAERFGCDYIKFDCDALVYDDLQTYKW